jgi:hypothetical protein
VKRARSLGATVQSSVLRHPAEMRISIIFEAAVSDSALGGARVPYVVAYVCNP